MSRSVYKKVILGKDLDSGIDISDYIEDLEYKQSIEKLDTVRFTSRNASAAYLLDLPQFNNGSPVLFCFGFMGGEVSPYYLCVINDMEPSYTGDGGLSLTVNCLDKGISMKNISNRRIWKNKTTADIVTEIAQVHGMVANIQDTGTFKLYDSLPQAGRSDMDFVQYLTTLEKDGNYIAFVQNKILYFVTRGTALPSTNTIIIGQTDSVMSFDIKYKSTQAGAAATGVGIATEETTTSANPLEQTFHTPLGTFVGIKRDGVIYKREGDKYVDVYKEKVVVNGATGATTWANTATGQNILPTADVITKGQSVKNNNNQSIPEIIETSVNLAASTAAEKIMPGLFSMVSPDHDPTQVLNMANKKYKDAKYKVLTATLREDGNPARRVNTVITVSGIAKKYGGNWYITAVTHRIKDKYETICELSKDAVNSGLVKADNPNTTEGSVDKKPQTAAIVSGTTGQTTNITVPAPDGKYMSIYVSPLKPVKQSVTNKPVDRYNK